MKNPPKASWLAWAWGSSAAAEEQDPSQGMTDEQRKELYEAFDYDEKQAVAASFETPKDALKMRVTAKLNTGSFALKTSPHGNTKDVISLVYSQLGAEFVQRPDNFEATLTLGGLDVFDGTTSGTLYPQIVRVKGGRGSMELGENPAAKAALAGSPSDLSDDVAVDDSEEKMSGQLDELESDPLLLIKYENNPLDERADNALTVKMKATEIIYHRGYIEAIYQFLKPPESQLESVGALLVSVGQVIFRNRVLIHLEHPLERR